MNYCIPQDNIKRICKTSAAITGYKQNMKWRSIAPNYLHFTSSLSTNIEKQDWKKAFDPTISSDI